MKILSTSVIAVLAGLVVANFGAQALAQDSATRDAAIHKCIVEAQTRFPDSSNSANQAGHLATYKGCMAAAGLAP